MIEKVKHAWALKMAELHKNEWFQRLENADLSIEHYKSYLQETYHHAGQNPQIQAYCTIRFAPSERKLIKRFYQHAISEIAHDVLALNDLVQLGEPETTVIESNPLASTMALTAFGYYQAQFFPKTGYLGYLFHLEFMPTTSGHSYMDSLSKIGVPKSAMSFIEEHATVDVSHNKMMESYIDHFIRTEADLQEMIAAATVTAELHCKMIFSAFENSRRFSNTQKKAG